MEAGRLYLKKSILALIGAGATYFAILFTSSELLIERKNFDVVIKVEVESPIKIITCYNALPDEKAVKVFHFKLDKPGQHALHMTFPKDEKLNRIFLSSEPKEARLKVQSISLSGAYMDLTLTKNDLQNGINIAGDQVSDEQSVKVLEDGSILLDLTRKFPIAVINKRALNSINNQLMAWPRHLSWMAAFMAFFLILFFMKESSFLLKQPLYSLTFSGFFLLMLFIPFISQKDNDSQENRTLAAFPELNQLIWKIPKQYNDYYNDHFPFRNDLGRINNLLKVGVFGVSPMPDHVRIGNDGWLYDNFAYIREIYMGDSLFSEKQLQKIGDNLREKRDWLSMYNIDFYFIMPPLKHEVYPEFLPAVMTRRNDLNKRNQLIQYLKTKTDIKLVDAFEVLNQKKDSAQLYYKTDTHWNRLGAFLVYQKLIQRMQQDHPELIPLKLEDYDLKRQKLYNGDLLALMNIDTFFYREPYIFIPKYDIHAVEFRNQGRILPERKEYQYYVNNQAPAIRLLVFRDSFCSYFIEHLSENFSYAGFSWSTLFIPERIQEAEPDIVVQEMMEMFTDDLLLDNPPIMKEDLKRANR